MPGPTAPDTFLVEGDRGVLALIESPFFVPLEVFLEKGRHPVILERCRALAIPCEELSLEDILARGGEDYLRGACAIAARPERLEPDEGFLASAKRLLIPLDFSDGGNLGPVIRTACGFGLDGIVVEAGRGVDIFSAKCLRASAHAVFGVPVFEVAHLGITLERLAEAGFILLGVSRGIDSLSLPEVSPGRRTAVLIGAEDRGLSPEIESYCAQLVHVPVKSGSTLNAAAEGSIVLYELFGKQG